jgi:hypothetical protein
MSDTTTEEGTVDPVPAPDDDDGAVTHNLEGTVVVDLEEKG